MAAPYFSVWHAKNKEKKYSTGLFKTNNANDATVFGVQVIQGCIELK